MLDVAVFCSAKRGLPKPFSDAATILGHLLADRGHRLVFGGGDVGLMGVLARAVHERGGTVAGYIPEALMEREGVAYETSDELVVTATMHERKVRIFERSHGFIVLPGGVGTLEEFLEILTLRQLGYYRKPIVVLNVLGYFDTLLSFLDEASRLGFVTDAQSHFSVAHDPASALQLIEVDQP